MNAAYVLWDWNGTLLDDTSAAIGALNQMLSRRGVPPISREFYRDRFRFPVKPFYAEIGFRLEDEDWDGIAREYHSAYAGLTCGLNADAFAAIKAVKSSGAGQSIISALRQDLLVRDVERNGVAAFMDYVRGTDNLDGASKFDSARRLLDTLVDDGRVPDGPRSVVLIGDALHDLEVADVLGVRCVLCAQGSHSAARLRAVAPTGDTLLESVRIALGGVGFG